MLLWPPELPNPNSESFKITLGDVTQRTAMEKGAVRARPTAKTAPTMIECQWALTSSQSRMLRDWFRIVLSQGSSSFLWPCPVDGGYHTQKVLFVEPPQFTYVDPGEWLATGKLVVQEDFGTSLWIELGLEDKDEVIDVAELTEQFRIDRVDIFVRNPPDSGTSDVLRIGWHAGDHDQLVTDVDVSEEGAIYVGQGHANAGEDLGDGVSALPKTISVLWNSTGGAPTKCDIVVVIPYRED